MSGGGIIIIDDAIKSIRTAQKTALSNPLVSEQLPQAQRDTLTPIFSESVDIWSTPDDEKVRKVFEWAVKNIKT